MSKFTFFWRNRSPFSNWYPSKFTWNEITFSCGEQYMMYRKAMLFNDTEVAQLILETTDPSVQKSLGRQVRNFNREEWDRENIDIMVDGLYQKFIQNEIPKSALLATGDTIIVEASPVDDIWGIGLAEEDPRAHDMATWKGENRLGIVLMKVRERILKEFPNE
jgi:hypothetical protein